MTREDIVKEFHDAFGHVVNVSFSERELFLRGSLIDEEARELAAEIDNLRMRIVNGEPFSVHDVADLLKEMADLQYVISGLAVAFGLPLDAVFADVHASNMSKLGPDGKPIYREDGKVVKGPNYAPPDITEYARHWLDVHS